jgi:NADPH:quinone reductase-like Zn-dependent oxidoreductase
MAQQQALLLEAKFGDLTIRTIDVPKPGAGEVLVKIQSAALNPMDWKVHKYGVFVDKVPTVFGWDIAGDVVQVGEGLESAGFAVGDRV